MKYMHGFVAALGLLFGGAYAANADFLWVNDWTFQQSGVTTAAPLPNSAQGALVSAAAAVNIYNHDPSLNYSGSVSLQRSFIVTGPPDNSTAFFDIRVDGWFDWHPRGLDMYIDYGISLKPLTNRDLTLVLPDLYQDEHRSAFQFFQMNSSDFSRDTVYTLYAALDAKIDVQYWAGGIGYSKETFIAAVDVSGVSPELTPEPSAGFLLASGVLGAILLLKKGRLLSSHTDMDPSKSSC